MSRLVDASAIGATCADCDVCGIDTYYRLVVGDGHVPLCSDKCERAWPRMQSLRRVGEWLTKERDEAKKREQWARSEVHELRAERDAAYAAHAQSDERHAETVRAVRARAEKAEAERDEARAQVERLRVALEWFADEGHYTGTYRRGAGFVDAVGLTQARAALLGMDPDDADAVGDAWRAALADAAGEEEEG